MGTLMDKKDLALKLKISEATIDRWRTKGLPHIKLEKIIRFDWDEVETWIQERNENKK